MDLISIIMPYYKKSATVKQTIDSIFAQTYKNFELIIIYDDEDKKDLEYLKKIQKNFKKILIFINKSNLGAGMSRNLGIKNAKGEFVAFIDADDTWHKKKLEEQINFMKLNNLQVSHTSYNIIDINSNLISRRKARTFNTVKSLIKSCDIGLSTVIVKRSIFNQELTFPNLKTKEDFVLWLKFLENNYSIVALDIYLTNWKKIKNSLSSSVIQKLHDGFKVYKIYMKYNFIKSLYLLFCLSLNSFIK
jgi:teichuronic acid biosynthesis glycosyltransferase TuaG